MDLRDIVEQVVGLDDDRRAITNETNRAVDALERAVLPAERFGIAREQLSSLRERLAYGSVEAAALERMAVAIRDRLVADARADAESLAGSAGEGRDAGTKRIASLTEHLSRGLDRARAAYETLGRLRALLTRRSDVEERLRQIHEANWSPEDRELLEATLGAREAGQGTTAMDARAFLDGAQEEADRDRELDDIEARLERLRKDGADTQALGRETSRRVVEVAIRLGREREELRRELAHLARDVERTQEVAHGVFQVVTKASDVLEQAAQLEGRLALGPLPDGTLGPLKEACVEQGIVSLLLSLRALHVDRPDLEGAVRELAAALGTLMTQLAHDPAVLRAIAPAWDEIAAGDPRSVEAEWEATFTGVLGLRREGGVLSVAPEKLAALAAADGLDPWLERLLEALEARQESLVRLVERLDVVDHTLTELSRAGGEAGANADNVRGRLGAFMGETLHAVGEYHSRVRTALLDPETGFAQLQARVAGFEPMEALGEDATSEQKGQACSLTLAAVKKLFTQLEAAPAPGGLQARDWKEAEDRTRREEAAFQRKLAASLARAKRLRRITFPPWPPEVTSALEIAGTLGRPGAAAVAGCESRHDDMVGALETLETEREVLEVLDLPQTDMRLLGSLARERSRRLLELRGAALRLLLRLAADYATDLESLPAAQRDLRRQWVDALLARAREGLARHVDLLDGCLFDLEDNSQRLQRFLEAFDAYHHWAQHVADTEVGLALVDRAGASLFADFESSLSRLGARTLETASADQADWRVSSLLESLIELYGMIAAALDERPTLTNVRARYEALQASARELRDRVVERAEQAAEPFSGAGGLIFS